jgi:ATP-dependent DNA helicase RecQ
VPPYVVFHDAVLREMAASRPRTLADLAAISGVGTRKRDAYGDRFLAVIRVTAG